MNIIATSRASHPTPSGQYGEPESLMTVVTVLTVGAVNDKAAYQGVFPDRSVTDSAPRGGREMREALWVAQYGSKLGHAEAALRFPGLKAEEYRR